MKNGQTYGWAVLRTDAPPGQHWQMFRTRRLARAYAANHGGEIFHVVRVH